jgi:hypothetical protein
MLLESALIIKKSRTLKNIFAAENLDYLKVAN